MQIFWCLNFFPQSFMVKILLFPNDSAVFLSENPKLVVVFLIFLYKCFVFYYDIAALLHIKKLLFFAIWGFYLNNFENTVSQISDILINNSIVFLMSF